MTFCEIKNFLPLTVPIANKEKKVKFFIFTLLCGVSKSFMKAIKAINFYFNTTFRNAWDVTFLKYKSKTTFSDDITF